MREEVIGDPNLACTTCQRRLYKASGMLRCHFTKAVACSHYVGPHPDFHIKLHYGPNYSDSLSRNRGVKK